ncbi:MAG: hypothetical protein K0Q49_321 [Haloplasmataceae bacterium]|jgi:hypothetical protein|nr:hypothetical protein [Haloplasmataceae bacterium]
MRAMRYIMLGVVGVMAYQMISDNQNMLSRDMRKMMKHNKVMKLVREIF